MEVTAVEADGVLTEASPEVIPIVEPELVTGVVLGVVTALLTTLLWGRPVVGWIVVQGPQPVVAP